MDNQIHTAKSSEKGVTQGFLPSFNKQTPLKASPNGQISPNMNLQKSPQLTSPQYLLHKSNTADQFQEATEEEKQQLEEKLAKNQVDDAIVIDQETKLRLQEVIESHRTGVMKRPSASADKIEANLKTPSTGVATVGNIGDTNNIEANKQDGRRKSAFSTMANAASKNSPNQNQQIINQATPPNLEENDKTLPDHTKSSHQTADENKRLEEGPLSNAEDNPESKASIQSQNITSISEVRRKSRFASPDGKDNQIIPPASLKKEGSFLRRLFGQKQSENTPSPLKKREGSPNDDNKGSIKRSSTKGVQKLSRKETTLQKKTSNVNKTNLLIVDEPETPARFAEHEKAFSATKAKMRKEKMYLFFNAPHSSKASLLYNIMMLILYVSESALIVLETDTSLELPQDLWIRNAQYFLYVYVLEYLLRLSCYNAFDETFLEFFKKSENMVDLFAVIYSSFETCFYHFGDYSRMPIQVKMLRALTILRWIRGFRFSVFNRGKKILSEGLSQSKKPLSILAFFAFLMVICFASLMFTIEANSLQHEDLRNVTTDPIDTIPEAIWWAIITVTTVGYGDAIPLSFGGKILSLFALLFGVILISLPVAIMGNKFQDVYLSHKNSMTKKQRKLMKERVDDPQISKEEKEIFKIIVMLNELEEINENIEKHLRNNKFLYRSITRDALNLISKIELTNKASALQQVAENNPQEILANIRRNISKKRKGFLKAKP